jgi:ribosomal protein S12 methylthiotransferase accessory factor
MLKVDGIERVTSAAETMRRVAKTAEHLGVTRVSDITGLDRVGLPIYSAIVPRSDDYLSVYNGKGIRPLDARVGAIMEAIERQTALKTRLPSVEGTYNKLRRGLNVMNPKLVNQKLASDYSDDKTYSWVEGLDIVTGKPCWVPAKLAGYRWHDVAHPSCFELNDTNGLASGNCREEAVCHALCELAERDAWTLAEIGAHELPRKRRLFALGSQAENGADDVDMFPSLDLEPNEILDRFHRAGLYPVVRDITSDLGIPAIFASVTDDHLPGFPMAHCGLGAHPDARVAFRRALTELAQSRCVDIQGVREDIVSATGSVETFALHTRRVTAIDPERWYFRESSHSRMFKQLASYSFDSIEEDTRFILDRFAACRLEQVIVVDFTPSNTLFSVVRVIVPGIELYAADHGRVGPRAVAFWKKHV